MHVQYMRDLFFGTLIFVFRPCQEALVNLEFPEYA